jgi:hypothetical protein
MTRSTEEEVAKGARSADDSNLAHEKCITERDDSEKEEEDAPVQEEATVGAVK